MIKNFLLIMSLFFSFLVGVLIYAAYIDPIERNKVFFIILSLIGSYPAFEFFKSFVSYRKVTYDIHKDGFIIYGKSGYYREIKKHEIRSISFETTNSLKVIIKMSSGDKINFTPPGLGLKSIRELEEWWGQELEAKNENLSFKELIKYERLLNKIKSFLNKVA